MPPKAKFTKEQITKVALEIVRTENFERPHGKSLGSQARKLCLPYLYGI